MPHVFSTTLPKAGGKVTARCPRRTAEKCCDQTSRSHANNQYITAKGPPAAARGRAQGTGGAPALAHPLLSPGPALPGAAGPGAPWRPLRAAPWDGPGRRRGGARPGRAPRDGGGNPSAAEDAVKTFKSSCSRPTVHGHPPRERCPSAASAAPLLLEGSSGSRSRSKGAPWAVCGAPQLLPPRRRD